VAKKKARKRLTPETLKSVISEMAKPRLASSAKRGIATPTRK